MIFFLSITPFNVKFSPKRYSLSKEGSNQKTKLGMSLQEVMGRIFFDWVCTYCHCSHTARLNKNSVCSGHDIKVIYCLIQLILEIYFEHLFFKQQSVCCFPLVLLLMPELHQMLCWDLIPTCCSLMAHWL